MSAQDSLSRNLREDMGFTVGAFRGDNATAISVFAKVRLTTCFLMAIGSE